MAKVVKVTDGHIKAFKAHFIQNRKSGKYSGMDDDEAHKKAEADFNKLKSNTPAKYKSELEEYVSSNPDASKKKAAAKAPKKPKASKEDDGGAGPSAAPKPKKSRRVVRIDEETEIELPKQTAQTRLEADVLIINKRLVFRNTKTGEVSYQMPAKDVGVVFGSVLGKRSRKGLGVLGGVAKKKDNKRNRYNHFISAAEELWDFKKYPNSKLKGCEDLVDGQRTGKARLKRGAQIWKTFSPSQKDEWLQKAMEWNAENCTAEEEPMETEEPAVEEEEEENQGKGKKAKAAPLAKKAAVKAEPPKKKNDDNLFSDDDDDAD